MAMIPKMEASYQVPSPGASKEMPEQYAVENTSLDLDAVSQSYCGLMKINRLLHIAKHCPLLATEATNHALEEVKTTFNIAAFQVSAVIHGDVATGKAGPLQSGDYGMRIVIFEVCLTFPIFWIYRIWEQHVWS